MATASCSQARSLSPTHAAIIARYLIMELPRSASFSTGRSSTARRPSRSACFVIIFDHTRDNAFHEWTIDVNIASKIASKIDCVLLGCDQGIFCSSDIPISQCATKPDLADTWYRGGIYGANG